MSDQYSLCFTEEVASTSSVATDLFQKLRRPLITLDPWEDSLQVLLPRQKTLQKNIHADYSEALHNGVVWFYASSTVAQDELIGFRVKRFESYWVKHWDELTEIVCSKFKIDAFTRADFLFTVFSSCLMLSSVFDHD